MKAKTNFFKDNKHNASKEWCINCIQEIEYIVNGISSNWNYSPDDSFIYICDVQEVDYKLIELIFKNYIGKGIDKIENLEENQTYRLYIDPIFREACLE